MPGPGPTATAASRRPTAQDGETWRITAQQDTDGNTLTFSYVSGAPQKLKSVTTSATGVSESIEYEWGAGDAEDRITAVVTKYDHDLAPETPLVSMTRTTYTYDGNRLSAVTGDVTPDNASDSSFYTTTYEYETGTNRITRIWQTDGSELKIRYDAAGRVEWLIQTVAATVTAQDTRVTQLVYNSGRTDVKVYQEQFDSLTDPPQTWPDALTASLYYEDPENPNQLTKIVAPPARAGAAPQITLFEYDPEGNVTHAIDAGGGRTLYEYDANGNVTRITDANGNVTARTYNAQNQLIREARFAGNLLDNPGGYPKTAFSSTAAHETGGISGSGPTTPTAAMSTAPMPARAPNGSRAAIRAPSSCGRATISRAQSTTCRSISL